MKFFRILAVIFYFSISLFANDWKLIWSEDSIIPVCLTLPNGISNGDLSVTKSPILHRFPPRKCPRRNGFLILEARKERIPNPEFNPSSADWRYKRPFAEYSSASLTTNDKAEWCYGASKCELNYRVHPRSGLQYGCWERISLKPLIQPAVKLTSWSLSDIIQTHSVSSSLFS